uniref:Uncharacterized protein n=1 Tax=Romanomermis culicivorax TaxID=13658 RepID=A0A915KQ44_ROMCU
MERMKIKWQGEEPSKYFLNMEKRNYNRKTIGSLKAADAIQYNKIICKFNDDKRGAEPIRQKWENP